MPGNSLNLESIYLKVVGACSRYFLSKTLCRMTACGQTKTHLPHWIHRSDSQTGISKAMLRFSHLVVPVGKVPSTGKADTGTESPSKAIMGPSTSRTNAGASAGTGARRVKVLVTLAGTLT